MTQPLARNPVVVMDTFEGRSKGQNIEAELGRFLTVMRENLVPLGLADYFWTGFDGTRFTLEHKNAGELMQDMGGRLDDQLRKHTQNADDVGLIIDGMMTPAEDGKSTYIWRVSAKNPKIMTRQHKSPHSYQEVMGYLWGLDKAGINIYCVPDWVAMCRCIAEYVYNTLKPEHRTLKRYIKSHPVILDEKATPEHRKYVGTLMGLSGARIGEITAKKILQDQDTPFKFFISEANENPKIGDEAFKSAMRAIGRAP